MKNEDEPSVILPPDNTSSISPKSEKVKEKSDWEQALMILAINSYFIVGFEIYLLLSFGNQSGSEFIGLIFWPVFLLGRILAPIGAFAGFLLAAKTENIKRRFYWIIPSLVLLLFTIYLLLDKFEYI